MLRPAAGTASRGLPSAGALRSLGLAKRRHSEGALVAALPSTSTPATALPTFALGSSSNRPDKSADTRHVRLAALVAGSALALWATAPSDEKTASCSSQAMRPRPQEEMAPWSSAAAGSSLAGDKSIVRGDLGWKDTAPTTVPHPAVALVVASSYNGNRPIEDRHDIRQSPRGDFFASVLDGHGGWQAAELARKRLNIAAQTELKNSLADDPDEVKGALTQAFLRVEREYLYQVKAAFELGFGAVARTGACAIMALLRDDRLFVANAGDCRAVLGRRRRRLPWGEGGGGGGSSAYGATEAVALSNDHNAREEAEQAKLRKLHPHEGDVFTCKRASACYVKGRLQPTRSLGDAYLKYPEFNGQEDMHRSAGRFMPPPYTPPYITAEPEISVHNIDRNHDDFVILASDGLWDHVTNAEAVEIVRGVAYDEGDPESATDMLIQRVLEAAAEKNGMSVKQLQQVPEGTSRRSMHDDITCVVFFLNGNRNNEGLPALQGEKQDERKRDGLPVAQ